MHVARIALACGIAIVLSLAARPVSAQSGYAQLAPPPTNAAPLNLSSVWGGAAPAQPGSTWVAPTVGPAYSQPGISYGQSNLAYPQGIAGPQGYAGTSTQLNPTGGGFAATQPGYGPPTFNAYTAPATTATPLLPAATGLAAAGAAPVLTPRAGGGALIGEDVGLEESDAWLYGFIPLLQTPGQSVIFAETRAHEYFDNSSAHGFNLAAGRRWMSPSMDRVHGGYASFDYRTTGPFDFSQVSFGADSLGPRWDFHVNGYLVVSQDRKSLPATNPTFVGDNLLVTANFIDAYDGFDGEIGRHLFVGNPDLDATIYVGGYAFYADGARDVGGIRVRGEATFWDRVTAGVAFQHDSTFDTTFSVNVSLLFGGLGKRDGVALASSVHRLDDPLRKHGHVVLGRRSERIAVRDLADDGEVLTITHVDSAAAAGGDGSFETPLDTLPADPATDIVLLHADSVFNGDDITLNDDNQRLLGDGPGVEHTVTSQFGEITLPRANAGLVSPEIANSAGDAVTIAADGVEVASLTISTPGGDGITGTDVSGIDINRVAVQGVSGGDAGLDLNGVVDGSIRDSDFSFGVGALTDGVSISEWSGGVIERNTATSNPEAGFEIGNLAGGVVRENTATGNGAGFLITDAQSGSSFSRNRADGNDNVGFFFTQVSGGEVSMNQSTNLNPGAVGFGFLNIGPGAEASITNNRAVLNGGNGFELFGAFLGGDFSDNVANDNTGEGYSNFPPAPLPAGATATGNMGMGNGGGNDTYAP